MNPPLPTDDEMKAMIDAAEADFPQLDRDLQAMHRASQGGSYAASVRRAIGPSDVPLEAVAEAAGVSMEVFLRWQRGECQLDVLQLDGIVERLGMRAELVERS